MKLLLAAAGFAVLLVTQAACAQVPYNGHTGAPTDMNTFYQSLSAGTVLIVSELHTSAKHHQTQQAILAHLAETTKYPKSVGLEFLYVPQQEFVDQYVKGELDETSFLQKVNWSEKTPFEFYRYPIQFPGSNNGDTVALNFPIELAAKVKENGIAGLSPEEKKLVKTDFELGTDTYYARFKEVMKDHTPLEKIPKYFVAQSLWDDTMAWRTAEYMKTHSDHLMVIIVGDFHVAYQDGLIARLRKRGVQRIVSVSQVDTKGLTEEDRRATIEPDPVYGPRADFVFDAR